MDLRQVYFNSNYQIDKILGTFSGTFTATGTGGLTVTTTDSFLTNIPERTLFQGKYTLDGGTTWIRFSNSYAPSSPTSPHLDVYGYSTEDTFYVQARNHPASSGTDYDVEYEVALIATPDQGDIDIQPRGSNTVFNSNDNYLKIIADEVEAVSLGVGGNLSSSIYHGLGYYPQAIAYFDLTSAAGSLSSGIYELSTLLAFLSVPTTNNPDNTASVSSGLHITDSDVIVSITNGATAFSGNLYTRVYGDD